MPVRLTGEVPPLTGMHSGQAPQVWRAPEGPEGTGGLRDAASSEARPPSLAGGRGLRRLENPWSQEQYATSCWAAAHRHTQRPGPARRALRYAERVGPAVCRAGGPCGTNSSLGLVSRRWADPGTRLQTRGRRLLPRPRLSRPFPRSCAARRRWTWPRRPVRRRGCVS